MNKLMKAGAASALAIAMITVATVEEANAQRRGRVIGGVAAGLLIGSVIAGSAYAASRERVYVRSNSGCGEWRRRAQWNEDNGRPGRAQYYWDRYEECRGG